MRKVRDAIKIFEKRYGKMGNCFNARQETPEERQHRLAIRNIENTTGSIAVMIREIGLYKIRHGLMSEEKKKRFWENYKECNAGSFKDEPTPDHWTVHNWKKYGRFNDR